MAVFKIIRNLSKKKFIQDVSILQAGSFLSLAISALTSIIFARLLGSDNYGVYALILAFVSLVTLLMDWGAGYAVLTLLPAAYAKKDRTEIKNILSYFFYITLSISLVIGLLALLLAPFLSGLLYQRIEIGYLARYLILAAMVRILFSVLILTLQSIRKIKRLTVIENLNKLIYFILPVSLVLLGYGLRGIVFGHFLSAILFFIASWLLFCYLAKKDKLIPPISAILKNFKKINFKKYFKFGFLIALNKNLDNLYSILPVAFLGIFAVTTAQVAFFKIALGYLALPAIFLAAVSRILLVQLPRSLVYGGKTFKDNFKKATLVSGFLFIFLLIFFVALAPFLISLLYGQEYLPAVKLVYVLSLGLFLIGFAVGYSSFFRTLNKLKPLLLINLAVVLSGLCIFFVLLNSLSPLRSAICLFVYLSSGSILARSFFIVRYFKRIKD